jgi:ADP-ribose pyrophosphatase YjhB (NUDIX family)
MGEEKRLNGAGRTEEEFLREYDPARFDRPSVAVDMLVFTVTDEEPENYRKLPGKQLRLLLIRRGEHPFLGMWALPGGFLHMNESLDEAAARELAEETGVASAYLEPLRTTGTVGRDPRTRVISCAYLALVDSAMLRPLGGSDAVEARWFTVTMESGAAKRRATDDGWIEEQGMTLRLESGDISLEGKVCVTSQRKGRRITAEAKRLDSSGIAFDHALLVFLGLETLRRRVVEEDLAFHLMPERFTLTELQQVTEIILGSPMLKANFRRKIAGKVRETGEPTKEGGHRPSMLHSFEPEGRPRLH